MYAAVVGAYRTSGMENVDMIASSPSSSVDSATFPRIMDSSHTGHFDYDDRKNAVCLVVMLFLSYVV